MLLKKQWYALLTRSRFENVVNDSIQKKSIDSFLPKIKVQSRRKDRKKIIDVPLFPGYLFVHISLEPKEQLNVLKTTGAVRILGSHNAPTPVPEQHIESLKLITTVGVDIVTGASSTLQSGDPVMVINGPFLGVKGEFVNHNGKGRVFIRVDVLGQFAGIEIDEDDIELLPPISS